MIIKNVKIFMLLIIVAGLYGCASTFCSPPATGPLHDGTSAYKNAGKVCYEEVTQRGRTRDGVYNSANFKPFRELLTNEKFKSGTSVKERFDQMWKHNQGWVMASFSHAAYLNDREEIKALLGYLGATVDDRYIFKVDNHYGYLAVFNDKAILVFRGTEPKDFKDILTDVNFRTPSIDGVRFHNGFFKATKEIWEGADIKHKLDDAKKGRSNDFDVYVTGHSLGAAIAIVSGYFYPFKEIVTFGEPRVARDNLSPVLKGDPMHKRYINGNDQVTNVPPNSQSDLPLLEIFELFHPGWRHHGQAINIVDDDGPYLKKLPFPINVDHSPVNYSHILFSQTPIIAFE